MAENYLIIGRGPAGITVAENIRSSNNKGEMGQRTYFKGDKHSEYVMITTREGAIVGAVVYGLPKIGMKLKDVIEKQRVIPDLEKFIAQKEGRLDMLLKILS